MKYQGRTFEHETVTLDDNVFEDCTFVDAILEYSGGSFTISGTTQFKGDWRVRFCGESRNTAQLMLFLIGGMGVNFANHFDVETPSHREFN